MHRCCVASTSSPSVTRYSKQQSKVNRQVVRPAKTWAALVTHHASPANTAPISSKESNNVVTILSELNVIIVHAKREIQKNTNKRYKAKGNSPRGRLTHVMTERLDAFTVVVRGRPIGADRGRECGRVLPRAE